MRRHDGTGWVLREAGGKRESMNAIDCNRRAHVVPRPPADQAKRRTLLLMAGPLLAAQFRIPVSFVQREALDAGALLVYGPDSSVQYRRLAEYVHRILSGAKSGELPVEQPTEFWLGVNLRTAGALGVTIPQSVLVRANEVID